MSLDIILDSLSVPKIWVRFLFIIGLKWPLMRLIFSGFEVHTISSPLCLGNGELAILTNPFFANLMNRSPLFQILVVLAISSANSIGFFLVS